MGTKGRKSRRAFVVRVVLVCAAVSAASVTLGTALPRDAFATSSPASATPAPVLSPYENTSRSLSRDDGLSVALPNGKALWIFGDTVVLNRNGFGQMVPTGFVSGGTSAEGTYAPGQVPNSLVEVPTPGQPLTLSGSNPAAAFMPAPNDVFLPDGSGRLCVPAPGQYPARWATGAALVPNTSDVLITYADMCVFGGGSFRAEGWGFMEYNWQTNALDGIPDDVFPPSTIGAALPANQELGSPVISNGQVSLFSFTCTTIFVGCGQGQVYAATLAATPSALGNPASYSLEPLATDGSSSWQPLAISVDSYPDASFRMIETTAITGAYNVLTAPTPAGPWHLETNGITPGCQGLPSGFCYALIGHPELSTPSQLVISYADPGAGPVGPSGPTGHVVAVGTSYTVAVPTSPQGLSAVASHTSVLPSVQLSWSPPAAGSPVTYNVYRSTAAHKEQSNLAAPIARGLTGTSFTDTHLVNGTTYYYVVTATNQVGFEGLASNEASALATNCTTYSSPSSGSHQVCGAIRAKYLALGGPSSFLGYPVTNETATPDGIGRYNHFVNSGSIYWTPGTNAQSIHGAIRARWASMGWERSCLGYPVSDEFAIPGGRRSNLQRGAISWSATTGATTSTC